MFVLYNIVKFTIEIRLSKSIFIWLDFNYAICVLYVIKKTFKYYLFYR